MKVTFYPDNTSFEIEEGTKLIDVAKENNIILADELCGNGVCGKCKVIIKEGNNTPLTLKERKILSEEEIEAGVRLACSFKIMEDVAVFRTNAQLSNRNNDKCENENNEKINNIEENKIINIEINKNAIPNTTENISNINISINNNNNYGVTIDIGTTNIVCGIFELQQKANLIQILEAANPQKLMGMEVVGRIAFANNEKKLAQMQKMVIGCINNLINRLSEENNIPFDNIKKVVVCGNTTMIHMFLGKDVTPLGVYPFSTGYMGGEILKAQDYLKDLEADAKLYVPPFIGGHVGSDALCCLYGAGMDKAAGKKIIVDMGTNAEIILYNDGEISACAAAAGPAFEGMGIRYGSKYIDGSVYGARIYENGKMEYDIKGLGTVSEENKDMANAKSICASGMIDILSILRRNNALDFFGTFKGTDNVPKGVDTEHAVFYLSKENTRVCINQADIRNIQLAKSAVLSGIVTLMEEHNVELESVDEIILTGAFGNGINIQNAIDIRLLPKVDMVKYVFANNMAFEGAGKILNGDSEKVLEEMTEMAKKIKHIELGQIDKFKDIFIDNMNV